MSVLWLTRDILAPSWYNVSARKRDQHPGHDGDWRGYCNTFCHHDWERLTGIKLKPGEGPVKIEIRRVK